MIQERKADHKRNWKRLDELQAEVNSLKNELATKNSKLAEVTNTEVQVRRVARKYKNSYFELKRKMDKLEDRKTMDVISNCVGKRSHDVEGDDSASKK